MNKYENTYCNPTPLPNYPIGRCCARGWGEYKLDYRETADPTALYDNGVWYLYPSCGMVYTSRDLIRWEHKRLNVYDIGYAPTVVKHRGKFLLCACGSELYVSDTPDGNFESLGSFKNPDGSPLFVDDPMLFSDDDGRLYLYSGCGGELRGVELDALDPTRLLGDNAVMFKMNTCEHVWERMGDFNEDSSYSWTEGAWLYKRKGVYYLTYSAPGTEWSTYAMGAYKSGSPLGPWEYMKTSPFLLSRDGLITGTGHGSIVDAPDGTTWVFYTCRVCYGGRFERRIGYDTLTFDENGDIVPRSASCIPCFNSGYENASDLLPLTQSKPCYASSCEAGRDELYALNSSMLSWWQPSDADENPTLTVKLSDTPLDIFSARLIWRDVGLDIRAGVLPSPIGYKIEAKCENGEWLCVLDKSDNAVDMLIDYEPLTPTCATEVRLVITKKPLQTKIGLISFTVFGKPA